MEVRKGRMRWMEALVRQIDNRQLRQLQEKHVPKRNGKKLRDERKLKSKPDPKPRRGEIPQIRPRRSAEGKRKILGSGRLRKREPGRKR